jgi:hypothetical protein
LADPIATTYIPPNNRTDALSSVAGLSLREPRLRTFFSTALSGSGLASIMGRDEVKVRCGLPH